MSRNINSFDRYEASFHPHFDTLRPQTAKDQPIPQRMLDPHYTDERFADGRAKTIFLAEDDVVMTRYMDNDTVEGAFYNYSDRIYQGFDYDRVKNAIKEAEEEVGNRNTAAYFETMLQKIYEDSTTKLVHIKSGVSSMTGYSYLIFGTISHTEQQQ